MVRMPRLPRAPLQGLERLVLFTFLGLLLASLAASVFLGPGVLILALLFGLAAFTLEPLFRRERARLAAELAAAAGAPGPIRTWGQVVDVAGRCPTGPTPRKGQLFAVAQGAVWPPLCEHAQRNVVREAERLERGEELPDEPVDYHDADHMVEVELHQERAPIWPGLSHSIPR